MENYRKKMASYFSTSKVKDCSAHCGNIHTLKWNKDGNLLATGSIDKLVNIFAMETSRVVKEHSFKGHAGSVDQLCWHPNDATSLATCSADKTVRLWDTRSAKSTATITLRGENINIAWSPDGGCLSVGNKEDLVCFIDLKSNKVKHEEHFKFEVNELSWNLTGDAFFMTTGSGLIHIYSYPALKLEYTLHAHPGNCICLDFDKTGHYFATGAADALVSVWDARELVCLRAMTRLEWPVRTISFSHDGEMIAAGSEDHFIDIGEVATGSQVHQLPTSNSSFTLAWHPKQYLLAFAAEDKYERDREVGLIKLFGIQTSSSMTSDS